MAPNWLKHNGWYNWQSGIGEKSEIKTTIKIVYQTIDGRWCETTVDEAQAQSTMDHLRSLPDVKAKTVRLSM